MTTDFIQVYYEIAFENALEVYQKSYLNNQDLLDKGFIYFKERDEYTLFELIGAFEDHNMSITTITREKYIIDYLNKIKKGFLKQLKNNQIQMERKDFSKLLESKFFDLNLIFKKLNSRVDFDFQELTISHFKELIWDLKLLYQFEIEHHKLYNNILEINTARSYFDCKELPYSFYERLYEISYTIDIIDDVVTEEEVFIQVFITPQPNTNLIIRFTKSNPVVAYFLNKLQEFFNGLTFIAIEKSGMFYNKQNKPLNATDLSAAKSRASKKLESEFKRIDSYFTELRSDYLSNLTL